MAFRTPEHNAKISATLQGRGRGASPTKRCPRCLRELPRTAFATRSNGYSASKCRPCSTAYTAERERARAARDPEYAEHRRRLNMKAQFRRHYGITLEEYDARNAAQSGRCAICGDEPTGPHRRLCVDHCHRTGEVRGLLCNRCNRTLGMVSDDVIVLTAMIAYVGRRR